MARCSCLVFFFTSRKSSVVYTRCEVTCEMFIKAFWIPCQTNYISGYIWHKLFMQSIKCSFFNQIIVYHSFYCMLLTFKVIFFYFKESSVFQHASARCLFWRPRRKNYLWFYLTQIVRKILFPWWKNCIVLNRFFFFFLREKGSKSELHFAVHINSHSFCHIHGSMSIAG